MTSKRTLDGLIEDYNAVIKTIRSAVPILKGNWVALSRNERTGEFFRLRSFRLIEQADAFAMAIQDIRDQLTDLDPDDTEANR